MVKERRREAKEVRRAGAGETVIEVVSKAMPRKVKAWEGRSEDFSQLGTKPNSIANETNLSDWVRETSLEGARSSQSSK